MRKASFLLTALLIIASFVFSFFLLPKSFINKNTPAFDDYLKDEFVTRKRLQNGLVVVVKEIHRSPIVSVGVFIRTGSASEGKFQGSGISHLTEHMLFKSPVGKRRGELEREIKLYGGMSNGATSKDYTYYKILIPSEHFNKAVEILKDRIVGLSFYEQDLEKEKLVILKEIMFDKDDPISYLHDLFMSVAYQVHPYKYATIGYEELLMDIKAGDIIEYCKTYYTPDNMAVVVVGDVDTENVLKKVEDEFGTLMRTHFAQSFLPEEPPQISSRELIEEYALEEAKLVMGFHTVAASHPDMFALDTLSIILGMGKTSRLYKSLYLKKALVNSVDCYNYTPRYAGMFQVFCKLKAENLEAAKRGVLDEVERIKRYGMTDWELRRAKNFALTSYITALQETEGQMNDLGLNEVIMQDPLFSKKYLEGINKVREKDIINVARKYLNSENLTTVALVPKGTKLDKQDIKKQKATKEPAIQKFTLPNGVRILLREDHSLPVVNFCVVLQGGLRAETKDINGISNLTIRMLSKGTKKRTQSDIDRRIESIGADLDTFHYNDSFGLEFEVLSKDFDKATDLLSDIIKNPIFAQGQLDKEKELALSEIKSQDEYIFGLASRLMRTTLFKVHPYGLNLAGTPESVQNLKRQDVINFYTKLCVGENIVIGVFGDIDKKDALKKIKTCFLSLSKNPATFASVAEEPPQNQIRSERYYMDKQEAAILIGFHTLDIFNKDKYALSVLENILSTAGGRLFYEVREKLGLAYLVGAFGVPAVDPGYFILYAAVDPKSIDIVKDKLIKEIKLLKTGYIPEAEFKAAKQNLMTSHQIRLQTNKGLAFSACIDELTGLGFDNYKDYEKNINDVTKEDLKRIAEKYFDLDKYCEVIILPNKEN